MHCLKCGKETKDQQVFCQHCLEVMDDYPVKPGVAIHLPTRQPLSAGAKQRHKRKALPPEEQVASLRRWVRRLTVLAVLLTLLLTAVGAMLVETVLEQEQLHLGKNYTIDLTNNQAP